MVDGTSIGHDQAPQPDIQRRLVADAVAGIELVRTVEARTMHDGTVMPHVEVGLIRDDDEGDEGEAMDVTADNASEALSLLEVAYGEEYPDLFPNAAEAASCRSSGVYGSAGLNGSRYANKGVFEGQGMPSEGQLRTLEELL